MSDAAISIALKWIDQATGPMKASLASIEKATAGVEKTLDRLVGAFAVYKIAGMVKSLLDTATALDTVNNKLKFVSGSAEGSQKSWDFLSQQSERLGLNILTAAESFSSFSVAARGTALQGKGVEEVFLAVAEASAVMGLNNQETGDAMRALTQMLSKGKVSAEELRRQLGEHLPGAFEIAARAMNVTTQELDSMLKEGKLLSSTFLLKFAQQLRTEMASGVASATESTRANLNRLSNAWLELQKVFLQTGFLTLAVDAIKALTEELKRIAVDSKGKEELAAFFQVLRDTGSELMKTVVPAIKSLAGVLGELLSAYSKFPDEVKGAAGVGIIVRLISGSTPLALLAANIQMVVSAVQNLNRENKKLSETNPAEFEKQMHQRADIYFGGGYGTITPQGATGFKKPVPTWQLNPVHDVEGAYAQGQMDLAIMATQRLAELKERGKELRKDALEAADELRRKVREAQETLDAGLISQPQFDRLKALYQEEYDRGVPVKRIQEELNLLQEASKVKLSMIERESNALDENFRQGLVSAEEYYQKATDLVKRSISERISALEAEKKSVQEILNIELKSPSKTPEQLGLARTQAQTRIQAIAAEITQLQTSLAQSLNSLTREQEGTTRQFIDAQVRMLEDLTTREQMSVDQRKQINEEYLRARTAQIRLEAQEYVKGGQDKAKVEEWLADQTSKARKKVQVVDPAIHLATLAQLNFEYAQLTGSQEQQLEAQRQLLLLTGERNALEAENRGELPQTVQMYRAIAAEQARVIEVMRTGTFEQGFVEGMKEIYRQMQTVAQMGKQFASELKSSLSDFLTDVGTGAKTMSEVWTDLVANVRKSLTKLMADKAVSEFFGLLSGGAKPGEGGIGGALASLAGKAQGAVATMNVTATVVNVGGGLQSGIVGTAAGASEGAGSGSWWDSITGGISSLFSKIKDVFSSLMSGLGSILSSLGSGLSSLIGGIGSIFSGIFPHAAGDYWFTEPTFAVGLRSGQKHLIAEKGPEYLAGPRGKATDRGQDITVINVFDKQSMDRAVSESMARNRKVIINHMAYAGRDGRL